MNIDVKRVKIVVFVPVNDTERVRDAMCKAGAGVIGNYKFCSSSCNCTGTFIPLDNANPYIGSVNQMEYVVEDRLEVVCDIKKAKDVISSLRSVHPYEEPAIDIVPLIDEEDLI